MFTSKVLCVFRCSGSSVYIVFVHEVYGSECRHSQRPLNHNPAKSARIDVSPRFGAASIRILTPGGAGTTTVGRRAQLSGVDGGCDASLRTSPGGEGIGGRLTGSCSVLLSRAQANRNRALVGAREAISVTI